MFLDKECTDLGEKPKDVIPLRVCVCQNIEQDWMGNHEYTGPQDSKKVCEGVQLSQSKKSVLTSIKNLPNSERF